MRIGRCQLLEMNVELQRLSTLDGLTGLSNRRYFNEYFAIEWQRGLREHTTLCSLMVDVDDFKRYNDTYGHLAGDEVLKRVAQRIEQSATRPADLAARFGGEEFVVVLPNTTLEGALVVAQNLCSAVAALEIPHKAARAASHVSVSVGAAAAVPSREGSALALLDASDVALYQAKKTGRNRAVAYCDAGLPHAATPQGRATG
jgi:two-component system chemotaxis family response regulator WspR